MVLINLVQTSHEKKNKREIHPPSLTPLFPRLRDVAVPPPAAHRIGDWAPQVWQPHAGHESRQGSAALSRRLQINDNYHLDMSTLITEQDQGQGPEPRWP